MREILLATGNPGKAREMREILGAGWAVDAVRWRLLSEFESWPEPVEDGVTFRDNAALKARYSVYTSVPPSLSATSQLRKHSGPVRLRATPCRALRMIDW